jgi:PIN domain nuclease of toxin-antitoxin system
VWVLLSSRKFLRFLAENTGSYGRAESAIVGATAAYLGHAAVWKMTIKPSIGRLRLFVAQAIEEGLVLVTGDATMRRYPVAWLW